MLPPLNIKKIITVLSDLMRFRKKCSFFLLAFWFSSVKDSRGSCVRAFPWDHGGSHQPPVRSRAFGFPRAVASLGAGSWTLGTRCWAFRMEVTVFLWWPWLCYFLIFSLISIVFSACLLTCKIQQIGEDLPALGVSFAGSRSEPAPGSDTRWAPAWRCN